jgi:transcription initiation factor TFIIIB Brf1 subunit/transcription initiation factor TFIIB
MTDFLLFEHAFEQYKRKQIEETDNIDNLIINDECKSELNSSKINIDAIYSCEHEETINEGGLITCSYCGEQLKREIMNEKEWRYYGSTDNKRTSDPNRVHSRKIEEKNINKDVENMGFSEPIIIKAEQIYLEVTKGEIYRGQSRKAIVFACIFLAYKLSGNYQSPESLIKLFGLSRKNGLKGLKTVNVNAPKDLILNTSLITITPIHIINDIMDKFKASIEQKTEVINLYGLIRNKSSKLNRARPQSVAASLIYYWTQKNKVDINLKEFAKKVDLSELTIDKNTKEITIILNRQIL